MNVSGPVRVFALVGGLAALAMGVWFFLLGGLSPSASSEPAKVIKPLYAGKSVPATTPRAKPKPVAARVQAARPAKARATKPAPKAKPAPKPKPTPLANPEKLPLAVARALARNPVVVVSLYDPEAKIDRISLGEARAGARRAGVAFVALNVLDRRASEALTRKLGVLSAPAFFLYRRPGELAMRVDGFADRDLVAQAAVSALPPRLRGDVPRVPARVTQARWSARANAICREGTPAQRFKSRQEVLAAGPALVVEDRRTIARLKALPRPTAPVARSRTGTLVASWNALVTLEAQVLTAFKASNAPRTEALLNRFLAAAVPANKLAARVGATACVVPGA